MDNFTCTFCGTTALLDDSNFEKRFQCFDMHHFSPKYDSNSKLHPLFTPQELILVHFFRCPKCKEVTIWTFGLGSKVKNLFNPIYPNSLAKQLPDYVPDYIRQDYEEAYAIVYLSPKASATLSRRCIQGMIRDFWGITKRTLNAEIEALIEHAPEQVDILHKVREIGNIGAHPEVDVNTIIGIAPDDAVTLLSLIEFLIEDWYTKRAKKESLFAKTQKIAEDKQAQKKKSD